MANKTEDQQYEELEDNKKEAKTTTYSWVVLLIITFIAMNNQWQRYAIAYANAWKGDPGNWREGDPKFELKSEFPELAEWYGYGLLSGPAFSFSYAIVGIFAGAIADRYNRKLIMTFVCIAWSACTLLTGICRNFWIMFLLRFMLGIFQGCLSPLAYGIISDYFQPESRSLSNSVYNLGIYFGGALSSISVILIGSMGWSNVYLLMGFIGFGSGALSLFFIVEPTRGRFDKKKEEKTEESDVRQPGKLEAFIAAAKEMCTNETCRYACIAGSFRFFGGYAIGFFMPKYFGSVYPTFKSQYSIANAFVVSMCGMVSSLTGGYLSDAYEKKGIMMTKAYVCIGSAVLGIPTIGFCCLYQSGFWVSMVSLGLEYLFAESWLSPCITMVLNTVSPQNKSVAVGAFLFFATLAGTASTTLAGAFISGLDASKKGNEYLYGYILFGFVCFSYGGSIPFMWLAGKSYCKKRAEQIGAEEREELVKAHEEQQNEE